MDGDTDDDYFPFLVLFWPYPLAMTYKHLNFGLNSTLTHF